MYKKVYVPTSMHLSPSPDTNEHSEASHKELVEAHINQLHKNMLSPFQEKCTKPLTTEQARSAMIRDKSHAQSLNKEIVEL
jgi:hypothetical protein